MINFFFEELWKTVMQQVGIEGCINVSVCWGGGASFSGRNKKQMHLLSQPVNTEQPANGKDCNNPGIMFLSFFFLLCL